MRNYQVRRVFKDLEHAPKPLTDKLVSSGYRQKSKGYITEAKKYGIENPTQYWHLIHSWSGTRNPEQPFDRRIVCGELIFWMAEASGAVPYEELAELLNDVLERPKDRRRGNKLIQNACFDRLVVLVENSGS